MWEYITIPHGMIICGIYKITSPTDKVYIGQAHDIRKRWKKYNTKNVKGQAKIYRSILKYGLKNHIFEVIEECDRLELNRRERYWQDFYDVIGKNGLNLTLISTDVKPKVTSQETKDKMSASQKGTKKPKPEGHGKNVSLANKGKCYLTDEGRKRKSEYMLSDKNPFRGKKHTEESLRIMSEKSSAKTLTEEHKQILLKYSKSRLENMLNYPGISIIMSKSTGIFYYGIKDAAKAYNMNPNTLADYLSGKRKKEIDLIRV